MAANQPPQVTFRGVPIEFLDAATLILVCRCFADALQEEERSHNQTRALLSLRPRNAKLPAGIAIAEGREP